MKTFEYIITDEIGIHARPAGLIVKEAKLYESSFKISCGGKEADMKKLMALMALGVKKNDLVTVTVDGTDEEQAAMGMENLFKDKL